MMAYVLMDRERIYFISNNSCLEDGRLYERQIWRQVDDTPNVPPDNATVNVPQPQASDIYYDVCGNIDQHNRHRQDTLNVEGKLVRNDWSMRVNMIVLSIIFIDT